MDYKTIVLHLIKPQTVKRQVAAASDVVAAKGGHVKGVFVMPPVPQPVEFVFPAADEYLRDLKKEYQKIAENLEAEFLRLAKDRHFACEWRAVEDASASIAEGLVNEARAADLIVTINRKVSGETLDIRVAPERIILESGRPVLILPEQGEPKLAGARVTIAWSNRREATRAVFDALPLLKKAKSIRVLTIDEGGRRSGREQGMDGADIAAALDRHGLDVDVAKMSGSGVPVGQLILEQVASDGSDVLVMGGYGQSRWREFVLGGATRHILEAADIPVLMSH
jgi:nucleotide-binding universal stress UspA family protein